MQLTKYGNTFCFVYRKSKIKTIDFAAGVNMVGTAEYTNSNSLPYKNCQPTISPQLYGRTINMRNSHQYRPLSLNVKSLHPYGLFTHQTWHQSKYLHKT